MEMLKKHCTVFWLAKRKVTMPTSVVNGVKDTHALNT